MPASTAESLAVVTSGGFAEAFKALAERYESQAPDRHIEREFGPSMGATPGAVPARLARGEALDVVIMVEPALDELMSQGRLVAGSKVRVAMSRIAKPRVNVVEDSRMICPMEWPKNMFCPCWAITMGWPLTGKSFWVLSRKPVTTVPIRNVERPSAVRRNPMPSKANLVPWNRL